MIIDNEVETQQSSKSNHKIQEKSIIQEVIRLYELETKMFVPSMFSGLSHVVADIIITEDLNSS